MNCIAHQVPLSMEFSRQDYWSGLSFPPPGDLPDPGIELVFPGSPELQTDSLPLRHQGRRGRIVIIILLSLQIICYMYFFIDLYNFSTDGDFR